MRIPGINVFYMAIYLTLPGFLYAQECDYFLGPVRYSFIDYKSNVLQLPENGSTYKPFFQCIDSLIDFGNGKIQILHIGGSHIQADIYTHIMRTRLQSLSPDMNGGRGLIFPYTIARTNNPSNYSVSYTGTWQYCKSTQSNSNCKLGLTGMAVITGDYYSHIAVNPNKTDSTGYVFDKVRIYHEPTTYRLQVKTTDTLITGRYDSVSGFSEFVLKNSADILHLNITKDTSYPDDQFALLGIELCSGAPGIVYNSVGVNGAMLSSYLRCELYEKHLKALKPDLIIISVGTNDGYTRKFNEDKYRNEYRQLLANTREAVPNAAILLTVPNDSYLYKRYVNTNTEKMEKIILELAREYRCAVWDFYAIMGGLNSSQTWYNLKLMNYDRVHFSRKGYELKGELFFSAFLKAWEHQLNDFKTQYKISKNTLLQD